MRVLARLMLEGHWLLACAKILWLQRSTKRARLIPGSSAHSASQRPLGAACVCPANEKRGARSRGGAWVRRVDAWGISRRPLFDARRAHEAVVEYVVKRSSWQRCCEAAR